MSVCLLVHAPFCQKGPGVCRKVRTQTVPPWLLWQCQHPVLHAHVAEQAAAPGSQQMQSAQGGELCCRQLLGAHMIQRMLSLPQPAAVALTADVMLVMCCCMQGLPQLRHPVHLLVVLGCVLPPAFL